MASATALYTPQVLALATSLAACPITADLPLQGSARSAACGSSLTVGLALDEAGRVARIGLAAHACAIGQAAAAIFAAAAQGRDQADITAALTEIEGWLAGQGCLPGWPGLDAIAAAQAFPARHGALLLPWKAARGALSSAPLPG